MKQIILTILIAFLAYPAFCQTLSSPESIEYDYSTNYRFISNAGNGSILRDHGDGQYQYFYQGLGGVRGLHIHENMLYAASNLGLAIFNLQTDQHVTNVSIPGAVFLNDVVADSSGNIYISDNQAHKIFKYDIDTGMVSTFVNSGIQSPNGMAFDAPNNRILLVSFRANSPLQAIQLPAGEISILMTTTIGNMDGIGIDANGTIFFSSWQTNSIYRLASLASIPVQVWTGLSGPADFYLYSLTELGYFSSSTTAQIWIPKMNANAIAQYDLPNIITYFEAYMSAEGESGNPSWGDIDWTTAWETGLLGYNFYYSDDVSIPDFEQAIQYNTELIPATNTSAEHQYHLDIEDHFARLWWIENIEADGTSIVTGPYNATIVANDDMTETSKLEMRVYPNPVTVNSRLSMQIEKAGAVEISFYDLKGRKICSSSELTLSAGQHELALNEVLAGYQHLPTGMYLCKVQSGNGYSMKRIVKFR